MGARLMRIRPEQLVAKYWNAEAGNYAESHPEHADGSRHPSWGLLHVHEDKLNLVGTPPRDCALLVELGCGDGHDAVAFARRGFQVIAIDLSREQLARAFVHERVTYVNGSADRLPVADGVVDVLTSDHGAFDHAPPERLLKEAKRVLCPGGVLVVCTYSPLAFVCFDQATHRLDQRLHNDYPDHALRSDGVSVSIEFSYASWIAAFRREGFLIERLEELSASDAEASYFSDMVPDDWARRWPCDIAWVVRSSR